MATVYRRETALGSFARRVWAEELERMLRPLRASPIAVPRELNGNTYADWQKLLVDGWATTDGDAAQTAARAVIRQSVVLRDELILISRTNTEPPEAIAALIAATEVLKEIILDADLLALRDSGSIPEMEEFVARYPDGPYTGTVLFAIGNLHEDRRETVEAKDAFLRMLRGFPQHPLYRDAYERMQRL